MGARQRGGRERGREDKTEAVGVDPRPSLLLSFFGVCASVCKRGTVCMWVRRHKCMFVGERRLQTICGDTRGLLIGSSTCCTEEKSIHIPEAHNGACRGSDGGAEQWQSRYTVQSGGHYMEDGQQSTGKAKIFIDLMVGIFTSSDNVLFSYL